MRDKHFIAIVDYGLGNLFSVKQACRKVGVNAVITSSPEDILDAAAVILTGVGAFARAMERLNSLGLVDVLRSYTSSGKPLFGICLGMQILMTKSSEFGEHPGLNIIEGRVNRLKATVCGNKFLKVPHVGWNKIYSAYTNDSSIRWKETLLEDMPNGIQMYFVHSYFVEVADENIVLAKTFYGDNEFCSGIQRGNILAFQFHPECSGEYGLKIYKNFANLVLKRNRRNICLKR